jgi:hypothetical protein
MKKITLACSVFPLAIIHSADLSERLDILQNRAKTLGGSSSSQTNNMQYPEYSRIQTTSAEWGLDDNDKIQYPSLTPSFNWQAQYQEDILTYQKLISEQEQENSNLQRALYSHKTSVLRTLENVLSAQEFSIKTFYPSLQRASNILLLVPHLSEKHLKTHHTTILGTLVEEYTFLSQHLATRTPFFSSLCEVIPWGVPLMLGYIWNRDTHYVIACTAINSLFFACTYLKKHISLRKKQDDFNKINWPEAVVAMPDHTKPLYGNPTWRKNFSDYLEAKENIKKTHQFSFAADMNEISNEVDRLEIEIEEILNESDEMLDEI